MLWACLIAAFALSAFAGFIVGHLFLGCLLPDYFFLEKSSGGAEPRKLLAKKSLIALSVERKFRPLPFTKLKKGLAGKSAANSTQWSKREVIPSRIWAIGAIIQDMLHDPWLQHAQTLCYKDDKVFGDYFQCYEVWKPRHRHSREPSMYHKIWTSIVFNAKTEAGRPQRIGGFNLYFRARFHLFYL